MIKCGLLQRDQILQYDFESEKHVQPTPLCVSRVVLRHPVLRSSVLLIQAHKAFPAAECRETVRETASAKTSNTASSSSSKQLTIPSPATMHHHPPPCVSMVGSHSNPCLPLQCEPHEVGRFSSLHSV